LESTTGDTIWQTSIIENSDSPRQVIDNSTGRKSRPVLPDNLGFMGIWDAGPNIALVGMGYKFVNYEWHDINPPFIALFDRSTGNIIRRIDLGRDVADKEEVMDFLWTPDNIYLLGANHLYHFDQNLQLLGIVNSDSSTGVFLSFIKMATPPVAVRSELGVFAFDMAQLDPLWNVRIAFWNPSVLKKHLPYYFFNAIFQSISISNSIDHEPLSDNGKFWVKDSFNDYLIDIKDKGRRIAQIPSAMESKRKGYSVLSSGRDILIFKGN
jgi:hypothetical protein